MTRPMKMLWVAGAVLLAVAGAAVASNMGFKGVPNLALSDPNIYDVSIPLNNNYTTLSSIFNDINASAGCSAAAVTVFAPDQSSCVWNGPFSCDLPYSPGQGIRVSVGPPNCTQWIIVGSHNPSYTFAFAQADPSIYDVAVPYHTTQTSIAGLFAEIPSAASVTIFNPDQSTCTWNGPFSCNSAMTIMQGVRVSVSLPGASWVPSHY